jgi:predicted TPR repeat methyltransferase
MPYSYEYFKREFLEHMTRNFESHISILDIGAGCGTYGTLLKGFFEYIDGVEVYEPYIKEFELDKIYNNIFCRDALDVNVHAYDYIIMGDVIEHMTIFEAKKLMTRIHALDKKMMVAIPYMMPQGAVGGNDYEIHRQDDLTHKIFLERYPMMHNLFKNEHYGVYINY